MHDKAHDELISRENEWAQAMLANDARAVRRFMDDQHLRAAEGRLAVRLHAAHAGRGEVT